MRSPLLAVFALTFVNEFIFARSATWNSDPTNEAIKVEMLGGAVIFQDNSTAGSGTFISGNGGTIYFLEDSTGDTSRIQVFGNGQLDISFHTSPEVTVGSIKGDGLIVLGSNTLTVGSNGLNTVFSGTIQDSDLSRRGSLVKIGTGELVLSHPNTYTGTTTISDGVLLVRSRRSSATGPGPVFVNGGTLGKHGART